MDVNEHERQVISISGKKKNALFEGNVNFKHK